MSGLVDQRARSRHLAFRQPALSAILVQVVFWVILNVIMISVIQLTLRAASTVYPGIIPLPYMRQLGLAVIAGILYGTSLGLIDRWMERYRGLSLGRTILIKGVLYTGVFAIVMAIIMTTYQSAFSKELLAIGIQMDDGARRAWIMVIFCYTLPGNFLISFINQVRRRFGPGLLLPLITGRYRNPVVEHRIFMFMDLRSSTTYAEALGHLKYSRMIRDLFAEVNRAVPKYDAEIYQYVGDEVIFTWNIKAGARDHNCLELYFAIRDMIENRRAKYLERYDFVPEFKAGLHVGEVTAVEIGDIKRDIAYHGDTVNTAARIQSVCNDYGKDLIISDELLKILNQQTMGTLKSISLGNVSLKGKAKEIEIHSINVR